MTPTKVARILWIFAVAAQMLVWLSSWAVLRYTGRSADFVVERGPIIMQSILAALPFVIAALVAPGILRERAPDAGRSVRAAAWIAFGVTLIAWGAYYTSAMFGDRSGGANIGLGWLLMLTPVLVGAVLWAGFHRTRSHQRN